ncbi:hypothetical protein ACFV4M_16450 [Kitasatospora indigofera]|uniref:hypothetical protein n=1 Tax=Kitasatospora indigofera TaxID=67307 RepID=UPI00364D568A
MIAAMRSVDAGHVLVVGDADRVAEYPLGRADLRQERVAGLETLDDQLLLFVVDPHHRALVLAGVGVDPTEP